MRSIGVCGVCLVMLIGLVGCGASLVELAGEGDLFAVRTKIAKGVDPNARSHGDTPLMSAVRGGHYAVSRALLDAGADPNARSDGDTPLTCAQSGGHYHIAYHIAKALLDAGADPNLEGSRRMTPLMYAAAHGNAPLVTTLLDRGAKTNLQAEGCIVVTNPLVEYLQFFWVDEGMTALAYAVDSGHVEVVRLLLRANADPTVMVIWHNARHRWLYTEMLADGAKIVVRDVGAGLSDGTVEREEWATPLMIARERGNDELIAILNDAGARW